MVVSLLAPGLGLLLLKNRDHVKDALLIFGVWFSYLAVSLVLTLFIVGILLLATSAAVERSRRDSFVR